MIKINEKLARCYDELGRIATSSERIGSSVLGREIMLFRFGENAKTLLTGGIHAREWITVLLLTELAKNAKPKSGYDLAVCLNPDGMSLCIDGLWSVEDDKTRELLLTLNNGKEDFSQWKANARGVDLNVNFDADWGEGLYNKTEAGSANYIGKKHKIYSCKYAVVLFLQKNLVKI